LHQARKGVFSLNRFRKPLLLGLVAAVCSGLLLPSFALGADGELSDYFFELNLAYRSDDQTDGAIANIVKQELAALGIKVNLHSYEWGTLLERIFFEGGGKLFADGGQDFHICYWIYGIADVDPRSVWHSTAMSPNGYQPYGYDSATADKCIDDAEKTWDFDVRGELYRLFQQKVYEDHPYAFLYIPKFAYLLDPTIQNFEPIENIRRLADVTVDGKTAADDVSLVFQIGANPKNIGPVMPKDTWTQIITQNLYEPLIRLSLDSETGGVSYEPGLAESWSTSADGMALTLKLRRNAYFSDGQPITARDVKMTIDAHRTSDTGSVRYNIVSTALGDIKTHPNAVTTPDDYTVVLKFKQIYAPFISTLTGNEFGIAPYHILNSVPRAEWATHWMNTAADGKLPVSSGPYVITEWVKDQYLTMKPNARYFGEKPIVDEWVFRVIPERSTAVMAMENGEVDIVHYQSVAPADVERLQSVDGIKVLTYLHPGFNGIGFNMAHPALANKYVRWAISYALPRQHIIDNVLKGMAASGAGPVPIQIKWAYNDDYNSSKIEYSIEKAKEYMEMAGYKYSILESATKSDLPVRIGFAVVGLVLGFVVGLKLPSRSRRSTVV